MKTLLFGAVAFVAFAIPAIAADLGQPPLAPAPAYIVPSAPAYDWSGFYLGGNGSYSRSNTNSITTDTTTGIPFASVSGGRSSWHGGGQIGFDYMLPSRIVIGIVSDLSTGDTRTGTSTDALGVSTYQDKTFVSGTVRGRLGYAIDHVLLYGTGGLAWSSNQATRTQVSGTAGNAAAGTFESVDSHPDGWTAGGGFAFAFAQNWNLFAEYRYASFTNTILFPISERSNSSSLKVNTVEIGLNYKLDWRPVGCHLNEPSC